MRPSSHYIRTRFAAALAVALLGAMFVAIATAATGWRESDSVVRNRSTWSTYSGTSRRTVGIEIVLRAVPGLGRTSVTAADLKAAAAIVHSRLAKLGVTGTATVKPGSDLIVLRIYGTSDLASAAALSIEQPGQLMLFDLERDLTRPSLGPSGNPVAIASLYSLLKPVQTRAQDGPPEGYYLLRKVGHKLIGSARTLEDLLRPFGGKAPVRNEVLRVPTHSVVLRCAASTGCLGAQTASPRGFYYYLIQFYPHGKGKGDPIPEMTGADLVLSGTHAEIGQTGQPVVLLQFTKHGSSVFRKITREEAQRGQRKYNAAGRKGNYLNYVQHFAIVLDGQLESTPYIDFKYNPAGIAGSYAEIDLGQGGTVKEAKNLALLLKTGALPVSFVRVSQRAIR